MNIPYSIEKIVDFTVKQIPFQAWWCLTLCASFLAFYWNSLRFSLIKRTMPKRPLAGSPHEIFLTGAR